MFMKFIKKILNYYKNYKKEFFSVNQTELTGFSKLLTILFFITSLWLIANGIQSSIHQSIPPEKKYGYKCESFANQRVFSIFDFQKENGVYANNQYDFFGQAPQCQALKKSYTKILNNHKIQFEIEKIKELQQKMQNLIYKQRKLKKEYDSMLLEKISGQSRDKSILNSDANSVKEKLSKLSNEEKSIAQTIDRKKDILNYPQIQNFILLRDKYKDSIINNLSHERRFYRLKISLQIFAFVIPIWMLFYFFYRYLTKKEKYIFAKLSFYVASAAALYGLVELVQLIYSIIPKLFLAKLVAFFTSHNMIIVLNILGILFFLTLFGVIIHKIQKRETKKRVPTDTKISNLKYQSCFNCGAKRKDDDEYCGFCGESLKTECISCNKPIYKYQPYCTLCGAKQDS